MKYIIQSLSLWFNCSVKIQMSLTVYICYLIVLLHKDHCYNTDMGVSCLLRSVLFVHIAETFVKLFYVFAFALCSGNTRKFLPCWIIIMQMFSSQKKLGSFNWTINKLSFILKYRSPLEKHQFGNVEVMVISSYEW